MTNKWDIDLSYEHKTACPRCRRNGGDRKGNNLHVYGEGRGAFCWSCEFTILSDDERERRGLEEDDDEGEEEVATREVITAEENIAVKKSSTQVDYRGIRKDIAKLFGVRYEVSPEDRSVTRMLTPTTINGDITGYKSRHHPKDFSRPIGVVGKDCDLAGQFYFKTGGKMVMIVGGEIDQLSAYQMLLDNRNARGKEQYDAVAVVSPTVGETGGIKQIQKQYAFFDQFERIIVCFDNDKAGAEATRKVLEVLPKGKVWVMNMRYKDPNKYIELGKESEFIQDFWKMKIAMPAGVLGSGDLFERILEEAAMERILFPPFMRKLNDMTGGIPLGKIVNIGAGSGLGKTTFVNEMLYFWIFNCPYQIGVVSMELSAGQYGQVILSRHVGKKIAAIREINDRLAYLNSPDVLEKQHNLFYREDSTHRFHLMDDRDGSVEAIKEVVEQLIIECGCRVIVLDPLQDILDGMSNEEQAVFLKWQKSMIKSHNVTFININHVRKGEGKGDKNNSTGKMISEEDFAGSSTIFKSAALNILLTRDKLAEDPIERNTTHAYLSKNRDLGDTGPCGDYYYDNVTHTLWELEDWFVLNGPKEF